MTTPTPAPDPATMIPTLQLLTTTEAAARCGMTRQGILARVKAHTLTPVYQQPANGGYLFAPEDIEAAA